MIGSQAVAAWIAQFAFWVLLIIGIAYGELSKKWAATLVVLWLVGDVGLPRLSMFSGLFLTSYVAVLDIALVFIVFNGDVRIG